MRLRRSLRVRVAVGFAMLGALVSVLLAGGFYLASRDLEQRLIDETLAAELEDYIARRERNPQSLPVATAAIRGYVMPDERNGVPVPPAVQALKPGRHQLQLKRIPFRAAVRNHDGERFAVLYNETQMQHRERSLVIVLSAGGAALALFSAAMGFWLAGRVIAPVTELVRRVSGLRAEDKPAPLARDFPWEEVRELAQDFDDYLMRIQAFIERERAFTSDVSHELRTPLTVISGATEVLLADESLPERTRGRLQRVARAAQEVTELTEVLLTLAREESGGNERGEARPVAVVEVLREHLDRLQELYRSKPLQIHLTVLAQPELKAERAALGIVVGNLLRNAFAYTEHGRIRICLEDAGIVIRDSGSGISPEDLPRIFDRFYRGANSRGAGIGLSLVKRVCDRYGWSIDLSSDPGVGTVTQLLFTG